MNMPNTLTFLDRRVVAMRCRHHIDSPVGELMAITARTESGVWMLTDLHIVHGRHVPTGLDALPKTPRLDIFLRLEEELAAYFAGSRKTFSLPLAPYGTPFQQAAWQQLLRIPYGQTRSYAEQAGALGNAGACRAVGAANARNPIAILIPCHRVIGADGSLTGYAGGIEHKRWLLAHEARYSSLTEAPKKKPA